MAVEIRELVIRATIRAQPEEGESEESDGNRPPARLGEADKADIVKASVDQVLRILKNSKER